MAYTSKQILIGLVLYNNFDWDKAYQQIKNKEMLDENWMDENLELIDRLSNCFVTILEEEYPSCFKELHNPPIVVQKDLAKKFSEVKRLILIYKGEDVDIY